MDPQQQFKERYDKYVASQQALHNKVESKNSPPGKKISKKVIIFLGVLALAFGSGALYALTTNQNQAPQIANTNPAETVKTNVVTDAEIDAELQKIWGPYYNQVKDDPKYRQVARKQIILERAANQFNINQSSVASENGMSLQQAIEQKVVDSKTVDMATVYRISGSDYNTVKKKITDSLEKMRLLVISGKSMQEAYDQLKKTSGFYTPITIQNDVYVTRNMGWDPKFTSEIFLLENGQVTQVLDSGGGSYMIAKVVGQNKTQYKSFQEWLNSQTQ